MLTANIFVCFAFLCFFNSYYGLEEISKDISATNKIREVANQLFTTLKLNTKKNKKFKEYSTLHNHFVSLTELENDSWKEILKLTGIDTEIDNSTTDFTSTINEVLGEENDKAEFYKTLNDEDVNKYVESFLTTLEELKKTYLNNDSYSNVNPEVLEYLYRVHSDENNTVDDGFQSADYNEMEFWVPANTRRIYKGERTKIKHFPFMASVQLFNYFACAGSIIKSDLVITAASCLQLAYNNRFFRENPAFLSVRVGSHFYNGGGESIPVMEVYFHSSYSPKTLKNNLAIMRLHRAINFRKKSRNVKKIDFDRNPWALPMNTNGITVVGWGAKTASNKVYDPWTNKISFSVLDVYPLEDCRDIYSKEYVTKQNFCAGFLSKGGGACNRDVGAPGVVQGILTGVVSFGSPTCGAPDAPTVFTKLGFYSEWIENIMEQDVPQGPARTTLKAPFPYPTILATPDADSKNFKIEPISFKKLKTLDQLDLRTDKKEVFKEFLQTMFTSEDLAESKTHPKVQTEKHVGKEKKDVRVDLTKKGSSSEDSSEPEVSEKGVTGMNKFDVEVTSSPETDLENVPWKKNKRQKVKSPKSHKSDLIAVKMKVTTPFDDDSKPNTDDETDEETEMGIVVKHQKLSKNNGNTISNEKLDEARSNKVKLVNEELDEVQAKKSFVAGDELSGAVSSKNFVRNHKDTNNLSKEETLNVTHFNKDNQVDEELEKQIDLLIKSLDVEKVVHMGMTDNFNDGTIIDDTKLIELIEEQDKKKINKKLQPIDDTVLTFLYLSEKEGKLPDSERSKIYLEQQDSDEKGLSIDSAHFKDYTRSNNVSNV